MGVAPTVCLKRAAKMVRDMPVWAASLWRVQGWPGSLCMAVMAMLMLGSARAESQPVRGVEVSARWRRRAWMSIM